LQILCGRETAKNLL